MKAIYDSIGEGYDTTRRADKVILRELHNHLSIKKDGMYLDVACGTGNYTSKLAEIGGCWHAFDQSETMLSEARHKSDRVEWKQYSVECTEYESDFFDAVMCSLAIHHFPDLSIAFKEIARILKPSGSIVVFTSTPEQMRGYWLYHYFPEMMDRSCAQMPSLKKLREALLQNGLTIAKTQPFFMTPDIQDLFLYSGKQRPEMYLSENVRSGISSFRNLCSAIECASGLTSLATDIKAQKIQQVVEKYENDIGDYLFIIIKKR